MLNKILIVCPVYNEEEILIESVEYLKKCINETLMDYNVEIRLVDDGSIDKSYPIMKDIANNNKNVEIVKLSRNFGQQSAILAGLDNIEADYVCIMDVDMQDSPYEIINMMNLMLDNEADMVYASRSSREGESLVKKIFSKLFYRTFNFFSDVIIPNDTGEFRVMKKKCVDELVKLKESPLFLRGMYSFIGFKQLSYNIDRKERIGGTPKFNFMKSMGLAIDGLVSFSTKLLLIPIALTIIYIILSLFLDLNNLIIIGILFILITLCIISTYLIKVLKAGSNRPSYIIDEVYKKI